MCAGWRSGRGWFARTRGADCTAADGPAVGYPDGWSAYAWKGVLVPRWMIERPELVTVRTIGAAQDPQIRRCMIEILTPERFIAQGGAYRIAQDETGVLWRQRWRWEAWAAVEVINGTPEAGRHAQALLPAGAGQHAHRARGRGLDLRPARDALPAHRAHLRIGRGPGA